MHICIVDDVRENAELVERVLSSYRTTTFSDAISALEYIQTNPVDMLIADQKMPSMTGLELIRRAREVSKDIVAIVVSAYTDTEDLIAAVNSNTVYRYLVKPFSIEELRNTVASARVRLERTRTQQRLNSELAIQNRLLLEENDSLRAGSQPILDLFAGGDPAMAKIKELALLYALSDEPVLITGETGTGKELLARVIHHFSPRRDRPFVVINCSNLGEYLLESTLFGHAKGAFTGADRDKRGLVEDAHTGTLFLDEIGDLPEHIQPKLLRFLQFQTFTPVGSNEEHSVDVRVVSATNKKLRDMTDVGGFRADLYFRLNTFQIHLPPLRHRRQDLIPIMRRIARARGMELPPVTDDARRFLQERSFPGNVRELQNIVGRLMLMLHQQPADRITHHLLSIAVSDEPLTGSDSEISIRIPAPGEQMDIHATVAAVERRLVEAVLEQEQGNISSTARRLGLSRQGLRNKLRTHEPPEEMEEDA